MQVIDGTPTPEVGDMMILDGVSRRITQLYVHGVSGERKVEFDHPDPEANAARRAAVAAWKAGGREGPPPEVSRNGSCAVKNLRWMDGLEFWYMEGRIDARRPRAATATAETARATTSAPSGA